MASGATDSHDQSRLPGRSLRSVSQASATDSAMAIGTVTMTRSPVLTSSSPTRGRKISATTVSQPVWIAIQTMKASGSSAMSEIRAAASVIHDVDRRFFIPAAGNLAGVMSIADCIRQATGSLPPAGGSGPMCRSGGSKRSRLSSTKRSPNKNAPAEGELPREHGRSPF
ncbi:hypothetical protein MPL3365_10252 [Mesorhizobium plurifarium]|uniref:Uncharacterized protein n=1 Tax=Mesorhizobium plurifarium TaxID=69974 RepID=A0A090FTJ2_MESPL|nr:hypothetical protein MPL3365_10252 [Mesorhizobium plurifarium]